jgi:hypothetical protein
LLTVTVLTAACASTKSLAVRPAQGQEAEQVERDRAEYDAHAQRERDPAAVLVTTIGIPLAGAAAGAMLGVGAAFAGSTSISSADDGRQFGRRLLGAAAIGAAAGLAIGAVAAPILGVGQLRKQERAYLNLYAVCLGRRGYWVP